MNRNLKLGTFAVCLMVMVSYYGCSKSVADISVGKEKYVFVEAESVKTVTAEQEIKYSGTIEACKNIPLSFSVSGTVSNVFVSEGDVVKKGQILAEINPETYGNSYSMALATLKQVEDAYRRLQAMHKNGNLPEVKMIDIETKLQQAEASAAIARKKLDDCRLFAAIDGVVGKRSIEIGQSVIPSLNAITIVKIEEVYASISVSENEIAKIKNGDVADIAIPAIGSAIYKGEIKEVGVIADPIAHTYKVRILMGNNENMIKSGMICNVVLHRKRTRMPLMIPLEAVMVSNDGKHFVYTVDSGGRSAVKKYVATGKLLSNGIEVLDGLRRDELVVVSGQHKISDATAIKIIDK